MKTLYEITGKITDVNTLLINKLEYDTLVADLSITKPNCQECAKFVKQQADNLEWVEGVKRGHEIIRKLAKE